MMSYMQPLHNTPFSTKIACCFWHSCFNTDIFFMDIFSETANDTNKEDYDSDLIIDASWV